MSQPNSGPQATESLAEEIDATVGGDSAQPTLATARVVGAGSSASVPSNEPLSTRTRRFFNFLGGGGNAGATLAAEDFDATVAADRAQLAAQSEGGVGAAAEDEVDNSDVIEHVLDLVRPRLEARELDVLDRKLAEMLVDPRGPHYEPEAAAELLVERTSNEAERQQLLQTLLAQLQGSAAAAEQAAADARRRESERMREAFSPSYRPFPSLSGANTGTGAALPTVPQSSGGSASVDTGRNTAQQPSYTKPLEMGGSSSSASAAGTAFPSCSRTSVPSTSSTESAPS